MKTGFKISMVIVGLILSLSTLNAQSKAVGLALSITGAGFTYEHSVEYDNFISVDLAIDTDGFMRSRSEHPGGKLSLVWNIVFAERTSQYGNKISFFAGPGIMAGYVTDLNNAAGGVFGMKGRVGMECTFKRSIIVSASLSPALGCHITSSNEEVRMRLYRSGLIQSIVPEIGIKYAF